MKRPPDGHNPQAKFPVLAKSNQPRGAHDRGVVAGATTEMQNILAGCNVESWSIRKAHRLGWPLLIPRDASSATSTSW
jgi:hypothetical protein